MTTTKDHFYGGPLAGNVEALSDGVELGGLYVEPLTGAQYQLVANDRRTWLYVEGSALVGPEQWGPDHRAEFDPGVSMILRADKNPRLTFGDICAMAARGAELGIDPFAIVTATTDMKGRARKLRVDNARTEQPPK